MPEFTKKKTYRKILYSPFTLLFLFIILLLLLKALWGVYKKEEISQQNLDRQQTELEKLTERQKTLAQSVEYMKTDKGIETEIRSKFRVVKEGESVAVIIDNDSTNTNPVATTTAKKGFFARIFGWFGFMI